MINALFTIALVVLGVALVVMLCFCSYRNLPKRRTAYDDDIERNQRQQGAVLPQHGQHMLHMYGYNRNPGYPKTL